MSAKATSQPPYPTASHVASLFAKTSDVATLDSLRGLFAPHCEGHVMGQEHFLSGPRPGGEGWLQHLQAIASIFREESYKLEIVNAFGGGEEPWVCLEANSVAKTKEGKDHIHDFVWVMRLNRDGQVEQVRAYYDSAHTDVSLAPEMKNRSEVK